MITVHTRLDTRRAVAQWRGSAGAREGHAPEAMGAGAVALVPTMGALHEGHLSLIDRARERAGYVVVSVYVNPLQFGAGEDLESYPRSLERDREVAAGRGADLLFAPSDREMYPRGASATRVAPGPAAERLCGAHRPGHFEGVLTAVAKLFNIVQPDVAVFGSKDYQQGVLIRRMAEDLDWPVAVELAPTVRDEDGLALSSRNRYLDAAGRHSALALPRALDAAASAAAAGEREADRILDIARGTLEAESGLRVQYLELVDPETLETAKRVERGAVLAAAVLVGGTRLIDNVVLP